MDAHKLSSEEVLIQLNADKDRGLSPAQVDESLKKHGANVLSKAKQKSLLLRIWEGLTEPMMIILLVAFGITLAVNIIKVTKGERFDYVECIGIVVAIALSVTITIIMEGRSAKAFDALNKMGENVLVKVVRGGKTEKLPQDRLVVGDIIKLEVGDKIPVDCRLISSAGFAVDESPLTGESADRKSVV